MAEVEHKMFFFMSINTISVTITASVKLNVLVKDWNLCIIGPTVLRTYKKAIFVSKERIMYNCEQSSSKSVLYIMGKM